MRNNFPLPRAAAGCRRLWLAALLVILPNAALLSGETWRFTASEVSSTQSSSQSTTVLDGDAQVVSDNLTILADHLELGGDNYSLITGSGGISLTDSEKGITIESGGFEYDRLSGIIRFREQVSLVDEGGGIVIRCESLDLLEKEDLVVMQISVRLIKDDIVCRGEFADYNRGENRLEISGRPVVWRGDDEYRADRIEVNLENNEIVMEGAVSGALTTEDDTEDQRRSGDEAGTGSLSGEGT